jgi:uncharacterized protein YjiS (DUF1127 family)
MLTRRQKTVLPYLMTGKSIESVARTSGVPAQTIRRWLSDQEFVAVLDELLAEQVSDACKQLGIGLSNLVPEAIKSIEKILKNKRGDPEVRLRAANTVCEKLLRMLQFQKAIRDRQLEAD